MKALGLIEIIQRGEDSKHQFKENITNPESLAAEIVAFSNTEGGTIVLGVNDSGEIKGLSSDDTRRLNQLISNTATNNVKNPINVITENVQVDDKDVIVIEIEKGIDKPYFDNNGIIWVKNGSDKRKVTSKEELRRLFQSSDLVSSDKIPVEGTSLKDIDMEQLSKFYEKEYDESISTLEINLITFLENSNLAKDGKLNFAGLLLFGKNPQSFKPEFLIKAVSFVGNDNTGEEYRDSEDITGNLGKQFISAESFILRNLRKTQNGQSFNSLGELEIPRIVFQEILVNSLLHRNYFIASSIKIFIFDNRIEIISPGTLPNSLTIENIKMGISNFRNPVLVSFGTKLLPYRGIGTGIIRAIKNYPDIDFINDTDNNQFKVIIRRHESQR
ncbi:MAG: RNA-binding domain-containing protein [bacterium]